MINRIVRMLIISGLTLTASAQLWAQRGLGRGGRGFANDRMCLALINSTPQQPLDATEAANLTYMREEEKLAHDVYATMNSKWGLRIFGNISQSEERHFDVIKLLLDRYGLPDPAGNNPIGVFQNSGLQSLYQNLISNGGSSLSSALRTGAAIEELDIRDLEKAAASTDNSDLKLVYQNLREASENHLRAFVRQLSSAGGTYAAQYITGGRLAEILENPQSGRGLGAGRNEKQGYGRGAKPSCPWRQP